MPFIPESYRRPIAVGLLVFSVVTLATGLFLNHFLADLPAVHRLGHYTPSLVTKVYDVRGELITELFVEKRSVLPLAEVPPALRQAFLATEDKRFYRHMGIDPQGIFRAMITNLRAGRMRQGASTITQQLAKNIFLTRERTLARKIKELILTLQIEYALSKDEILQLYMNQIYFGHGAYGIESAARTFFGKDVRALTLPECALLAGLPKGPERFSPFRHPQRAFRRRNIVLQRMKEEGFITEHDLLKSMGISHSFKRKPVEKANAAYFIEAVRIQLEPKYGTDTLYKGGLSIYTTMDLRMQKAAEETTQKHWAAFDENYAEQRLLALLKSKKITQDYFDRWKKWKADPKNAEDPDDFDEPVPVQGALVCIDPHTGGVRALVGGRNFQESQFNRATQAKRQPGSTFKPFVWQTALDNGLTAATVVDDWPIAYTDMEHNPRLVAEATDYAVLKEMVTDYYKIPRAPDVPDPIWAPQNWDNKFLGPITLRRGFALSRNLVSVRIIDRVGPAAVAKTAQQAGISSPLEAVLSLGLGSSVVTPLELVSAVGTYANSGVHMRPFMVTRVVDRTGKVLEENVIQGSPGPSPQSAYLVTRLMQAVVQEGTAGYARNLGRPAAGKTGTTQDMRDLWFVGFVPDLVTGVWLGYDDFTPLGKKLTSSGTTVPIWTDFMAEAAKYVPNRDFSVPPGIVFSKIDRDTGFLALPTCPHVVLEGFREGLAPTVFCPTNHDAEEPPLDQDVTE